ncbi:MAG: alpha/beta hydrolase [Anaerolineae bacterium]|nr:alpha/beta hydrolase [Anaerolineae bacterium]
MTRRNRFIKWFGVVAAIAMLFGLVGPLLIPYQSVPGSVAPQALAGPDSRFMTINGVSIHYERYGQGEPVFILLHGTLANTYTWHEVIESLARIGTVIAYDRPPFGLSSRPMPGEWEGESPYSYESQVAILIGLMDELNISQAILVGNSMGGSIAMLTAQRHPDRVQALILAAPAQTSHGFPDAIRWLFATPQMRRLGPLFLRSQVEQFGMELYAKSWHDPSRIQVEDTDAYMAMLHIQNWDRGLWELLAAAKPFETILDAQAITVPTLVITGNDDRVLGTAANEDLAGKIPGAQLEVIAECGHVPQEECPDDFMDAVTRWFDHLR